MYIYIATKVGDVRQDEPYDLVYCDDIRSQQQQQQTSFLECEMIMQKNGAQKTSDEPNDVRYHGDL
jgi:hypothetical protein